MPDVRWQPWRAGLLVFAGLGGLGATLIFGYSRLNLLCAEEQQLIGTWQLEVPLNSPPSVQQYQTSFAFRSDRTLTETIGAFKHNYHWRVADGRLRIWEQRSQPVRSFVRSVQRGKFSTSPVTEFTISFMTSESIQLQDSHGRAILTRQE